MKENIRNTERPCLRLAGWLLAAIPVFGSLSSASDSSPEFDAAPAILRVAAVYNDREIQIRYEFPTDEPNWYHQYLVYEGGDWVRYGDASEGPDEDGLYEDRISMMLDDGSVDGFASHGGMVTAHAGMRSRQGAVPREDVEAHPYLGRELGRSDVRKFIMESREGAVDSEAWKRVRPVEELERLREAGVFLDLWQWRAHRSHPVGYADNGYVLEYRHSSEGRSMFTNNVDADTGLPLKMYDEGKSGLRALRIERLREKFYRQDDPYFLSEETAVSFDPDLEWEEGDALPHRLLREPAGSRGAIRASGRYEDGAWRIRLTRSLEAENPLDSKSLRPGATYHVAFAVHSGATGARWHRVSAPQTLGLETDADITARYVEGDLDSAEASFSEVLVFFPGEMKWGESPGAGYGE